MTYSKCKSLSKSQYLHTACWVRLPSYRYACAALPRVITSKGCSTPSSMHLAIEFPVPWWVSLRSLIEPRRTVEGVIVLPFPLQFRVDSVEPGGDFEARASRSSDAPPLTTSNNSSRQLARVHHKRSMPRYSGCAVHHHSKCFCLRL